MDLQGLKDNFSSQFNYEKFGFYNLVQYDGNYIGFSVKKDFDKKDFDENKKKTSLISIFIPYLVGETAGRKIINFTATYGVEAEDGGVYLRQESGVNFKEPLDVRDNNSFFYDIEKNKFFKKKKEISADKLLNEIYSTHIKITKPLMGLWLRIKLFFWRIIYIGILKGLSLFFSYFLYTISGDLYKSDPIDKLIARHDQPFQTATTPPEVRLAEESKKIEFLGYRISLWSVAVYSFINLILYSVFVVYDYHPFWAVNIIKYNFLTLVYVVFSLSIFDVVIPVILRKLIDFFSDSAFKSVNKKISV